MGQFRRFYISTSFVMIMTCGLSEVGLDSLQLGRRLLFYNSVVSNQLPISSDLSIWLAIDALFMSRCLAFKYDTFMRFVVNFSYTMWRPRVKMQKWKSRVFYSKVLNLIILKQLLALNIVLIQRYSGRYTKVYVVYFLKFTKKFHVHYVS